MLYNEEIKNLIIDQIKQLDSITILEASTMFNVRVNDKSFNITRNDLNLLGVNNYIKFKSVWIKRKEVYSGYEVKKLCLLLPTVENGDRALVIKILKNDTNVIYRELNGKYHECAYITDLYEKK